MNTSRYITTIFIGCSLTFGPPAAELVHKNSPDNKYVTIIHRGSHEHPPNEHETTYVGEPHSMGYSASSATAISFTQDSKWTITSSSTFQG